MDNCEFRVLRSHAFASVALWSPARNGLTFWLLLAMFIVFLLLSHVISWVLSGP